MSAVPASGQVAGGLAADRYERGLAIGAILLLALAIAALARGYGAWERMGPLVVAHIVTVLLPLALTPLMLLRPRGDRSHRAIGWIWAALMFATALITFGIHATGPGFSFIHIFSVITVVTVPLLVLNARRRRLKSHRRAARGLVTGALLVAGYFALVPGRLLGTWLWG